MRNHERVRNRGYDYIICKKGKNRRFARIKSTDLKWRRQRSSLPWIKSVKEWHSVNIAILFMDISWADLPLLLVHISSSSDSPPEGILNLGAPPPVLLCPVALCYVIIIIISCTLSWSRGVLCLPVWLNPLDCNQAVSHWTKKLSVSVSLNCFSLLIMIISRRRRRKWNKCSDLLRVLWWRALEILNGRLTLERHCTSHSSSSTSPSNGLDSPNWARSYL